MLKLCLIQKTVNVLTILPAILPCDGFCLTSSAGMSVSRRKNFLTLWGSSCIPDGKSSVNRTLGSSGAIDDAAGDEIASTSSPVMK